MILQDKFQLTLEQNRFLAKKNIVEMIHSISRLENVKHYFSANQNHCGRHERERRVHRWHSGDFEFEKRVAICAEIGFAVWFEFFFKINVFVAYNESLAWGELRTGNVGIAGVGFVPPIPIKNQVEQVLDDFFRLPESATYRILKTMYYMMRSQLFWDGNKRTAIICANYQMIRAGCGIININEMQLEQWHTFLSAFYESNDDRELIVWTYENCVYGISWVSGCLKIRADGKM